MDQLRDLKEEEISMVSGGMNVPEYSGGSDIRDLGWASSGNAGTDAMSLVRITFRYMQSPSASLGGLNPRQPGVKLK